MGIPTYIICSVIVFVYHANVAMAVCKCKQRSDEVKFCNADFVINAAVRGRRSSPNPDMTLYQISLRKILKDEDGVIPVDSYILKLQVPKKCNVVLRKRDTYFLTDTPCSRPNLQNRTKLHFISGMIHAAWGSFAGTDESGAPILQTTGCELVSSYNSGRYTNDNAFRNQINAWQHSKPDCKEIALWNHFSRK